MPMPRFRTQSIVSRGVSWCVIAHDWMYESRALSLAKATARRYQTVMVRMLPKLLDAHEKNPVI